MTEWRRHPLTGDPILFAPNRAGRPHAFGAETADNVCPFCPGNEHETPPQIIALGDPWRARVFPNKYPPADGAEVLVESSAHEATFDRIDDAAEIVRLYVERYAAHREMPYVALFKNEGTRAGASIAHVHSQLIPLPFVPPRIARELEGFARSASCPLCDVDGVTIRETEHFRWLAPAASSMAYQQWIVPRRHVQELSDLTHREIEELGELLREASAAMLGIADAYNWSFQSFARAERAHFYVELFPRLTHVAGLELGTGTFVEIIDPSAAAERLRR